MAADRQNINKSWESIQAKYVGTGHSDMTKYEWATNQHRDTFASHVGHYDLLSYFAVAQVSQPTNNFHKTNYQNIDITIFAPCPFQNDSVGRVRYQLLEKFLQPCGKPPEREDEDA